MSIKVFALADQAIVDPITIVPELCTGCNLCLHVCPVDLFLPNDEKGGPPLVLYPGECWYEGSCVDVCPEPGAITLNRPPATRVNWKPKAALGPLGSEKLEVNLLGPCTTNFSLPTSHFSRSDAHTHEDDRGQTSSRRSRTA